MRITATYQVLPAIVFAALLPVASAFEQPDQRILARHVLGEDREQRSHALKMTQSLEPATIGPELRRALIQALARENAAVRVRGDALQRGDKLSPREDDFYGRVIERVATLKDPEAIPALAGALGTGLMAIRALAGFGDSAVNAVVDVAISTQSQPHKVSDALIALRFIVEGREKLALSDGSLASIRHAAQQRLNGKEFVTTLGNAIDLAVAVEDPELAAVVASLASDPQTVVARGITEQDLIERVQQRARDRLAGVPPMPGH